jgi:phosphatidylglycerophosphatase A
MVLFLASGFWTGYLPYMPGTWGSLMALPIVWFFISSEEQGLLFITIFITLLGWGVSQKLVEKNPTDLDPSYIVIDEIAGLLLTYCIIQWFNAPLTGFTLGVGFICFRIFDIWKPFPINWVDQQLAKSVSTAGLGIMIDDLIAAVPAAAFATLILSF